MKKRVLGDYLEDMLTAIAETKSFTSGMGLFDFKTDKKTINAVVRSLEVIGEATKRIPEALRLQYPEIPWKRMAGMRDKLIHQYFGVDLDMVWEVVSSELPPLEPLIQKVLTELEE